MVRSASFGVLLASVAWSVAFAQAPASVQPGQRVRVQSRAAQVPTLTGVVQAFNVDTLVLHPDAQDGAGAALAIPVASIERLQVSRGRHSKWLTGLVIGAGVGAVSGAIIGAATGEEDWLTSTGEYAVMGVVLFTPIGALTGTLIGLMVKTERWETAPLTGVAPTVSRGPGGRVSVGLRLTL